MYICSLLHIIKFFLNLKLPFITSVILRLGHPISFALIQLKTDWQEIFVNLKNVGVLILVTISLTLPLNWRNWYFYFPLNHSLSLAFLLSSSPLFSPRNPINLAMYLNLEIFNLSYSYYFVKLRCGVFIKSKTHAFSNC